MKIKKIAAISSIAATTLVLTGALVSGLLWLEGQFSTVEVLAERTDLSISDDKIDRAKQDIRWLETNTKFERRPEPPTEAEAEILKAEKERLKELREQRHRKEQYYMQRRK